MPPNTSLARITPAPDAPKPVRRKKALVIARVSVLSPKALTRLRMAQQQGLALAVSFDGYTLTVTEGEG